MSKDQSKAREKIQELVQKFRREQAAGVIDQYNESETKTGFIEPLLQALGLNTQELKKRRNRFHRLLRKRLNTTLEKRRGRNLV